MTDYHRNALRGTLPLLLAVTSLAACDVASVVAPEANPSTSPPTTKVPGTSNPFTGARLYVDSSTSSMREFNQWRSTRPADAMEIGKIANTPQAIWIGDWFSDVQSVTRDIVTRVTSAGALPVLVLYNIPQRDCGLYSAGGANSAAAYRTWIAGVANGIGERRAVILLEPDAAMAADCLSSSDRALRFQLLREAVATLKSKAGISVYIDGGHAGWDAASVAAGRLLEAGIAQADGFALNVSNFQTNANSVPYGTDVSARVGGKHFVIDTSRNGLGPGSHWCNPDGRALGSTPSTQTSHPLVDALLWVKSPGESDGTCNSGPAAGMWWPEYALAMARRTTSIMLTSAL